jgi:hypothetical protein
MGSLGNAAMLGLGRKCEKDERQVEQVIFRILRCKINLESSEMEKKWQTNNSIPTLLFRFS